MKLDTRESEGQKLEQAEQNALSVKLDILGAAIENIWWKNP